MHHKRQGYGKVVLECVHPETAEGQLFGKPEPVTIRCSYPLKFILPDHTGNNFCRWIYPLSFGGGFVGGDSVEITIHVKENCCGLFTSQESTKIYHCEGDLISYQKFHGIVDNRALLCVLPDYVVCYKDARFKQHQKIEMTKQANLVFLDWLTAGRVARNEAWEFNSYINKTEILVDGDDLLNECVQLESLPCMTLQSIMGDYKVMGTCILIGQKLEKICETLYKDFSKTKGYGEKHSCDTVVTASKIEHKSGLKGVYLKFLSDNTAKCYGEIKKVVDLLLPILGSDPFQDKY